MTDGSVRRKWGSEWGLGSGGGKGKISEVLENKVKGCDRKAMCKAGTP